MLTKFFAAKINCFLDCHVSEFQTEEDLDELSDNDEIKDKISSTEIRKFLSVQKL